MSDKKIICRPDGALKVRLLTILPIFRSNGACKVPWGQNIGKKNNISKNKPQRGDI
jgi:hypothetical protein